MTLLALQIFVAGKSCVIRLFRIFGILDFLAEIGGFGRTELSINALLFSKCAKMSLFRRRGWNVCATRRLQAKDRKTLVLTLFWVGFGTPFGPPKNPDFYRENRLQKVPFLANVRHPFGRLFRSLFAQPPGFRVAFKPI